MTGPGKIGKPVERTNVQRGNPIFESAPGNLKTFNLKSGSLVMKRSQLFATGLVLGLGLALFQLGTPAQGQTTYNWDAGVTGGPNDGSGTWSLTGSNWWTGSSDVLWPNTTSYAAQFGTGSGGSTAYSVTLDPAGVTAGGITFQNQAYTLTGSTLDLDGSTPTVTVNAGVGTISSPIAGSSGLTKAGNGNLILNGLNTYSGPTIVSAGTLQAGPVSVPVSDYLFGGATGLANNNNYRAAGGGSGFGNPNTPNTPWTPTGSSWTFQNTAGIVVGNGGWGVHTPEPGGSNQAAALQYYTVGIPMCYQTLNFPAAGTYTIGVQGSYATVTGQGGAPVSLYFNTSNGTGGVLEGSFTPTSNSWNPYSISFPVSAAGNYQVSFQGFTTGTNYIECLSDVTETANLNMVPNGTALTVASGATADFKGASQSISSLSDGTPGAGGKLTNSAAGTSVLLTINPSGSSTFSGAIQNGSGSIGLALNGNGTQVLAGSNTFTGATTISAGTLNLANANALKNSTVSVGPANGLLFSPGVGTFNLGGLSGPSNVALNDTSGTAVTLSAGGNNANSAYSGVLSGPGSFIKTGSGTLFLANSSSYTGATIIAGGTLKLPAPAGTVAATTSVVTASPGTPVGRLSVIGGLTPTSNTNPAPGQGGNVGPTGPVSVLTDGINNTNHNAAGEASWYTIGNNTSLTYTLPASSQGFNVSNINLFANWDDQGRSQITVSNISYSTVGSPTVFTPIANTAVNSNPGSSNEASYSASGGVMATNVYAIQINFGGQENNFVGYGEMEVLGNAVAAAGSSNFLPTTTAVQLGAASGSATLDLSGVNQQVASLSDYSGFTNGVVTSNGGPATLTLSATGGSTVFSGAIQNGSSSGVMTLVMSGSGTQVLAGANTYTGGTTISNGSTLQLGTGASGGDGSIAGTSGVTNNGSLAYNLFGSQTLSTYAISGSGSLTKLGPGSLAITTNNLYTGSTTIGGGTLQIGNGGTVGAIGSTNNVVDNGALVFNRSDNYGGNFNQVISGTGSLNLAGGTLNLAGINTYTGATSVNSGVLVLSAGTTNVGSSLINVGSAGTLNVSSFGGGSGIALTSGQTLRGNGQVVGPVAVPSGATVLSGTGIATGTGIGTLTLANNLSLASGATVTDYLGTPGSGTASLGNAGVINVQGTLTLPASGLNLSLLNNSGAGGLGSAGNGFYELFSYGSLTGNPSSAFPASIGAKQFTYYNPPGQIDVQVSILSLNWTGSPSSSWDTAGSTNWALGSAAASYLDGANVTFSDTNPITGGSVSSSSVVIQAAGVQPNSVTFSNNSVNYTISTGGTAGIAGSTGIVLSGSGTVNLQSPNSFQGSVAINAGILNVTNSAALGSSAGVLVASGGALQMQGNIALAAPLSLNGSGFAGSPAGALNSVSGTNSYAGGVTLGSPSTISATAGQLTLTGGINTAGNVLAIGGAGNTTISTLGISGTGGLTVAGPGTTTLLAASSYTGTTSVTGGVLAIPGGFSIPSTAVNVTGGSMIVQTAFNAPAGSVNLNGGLLQTPGWSGATNTSVSINGGTLQANASGVNFLNGNPADNVNINAGGAVIDTQANNIAIAQPFVGSGGLNKKGSGTLTLNAASSYNGSTVISAGVLKLTGGPAPLANDTFTSDATALIGTTSPYGSGNYTTALAFNQGANLVINGVTFNNTGTAGSGAGNLGSSWSVSGLPNFFASGNFPSGFTLASNQTTYSLLNRFYYGQGNGSVEDINLTGLVSGDTYDARLYYRSWGGPGDTRDANFVFSSGSASAILNNLNEDADANAHYLDYQFVASGGSMTIAITPPGAGSWHVYGFSNQLIPSAGSLPTNTPLTIASGGTLDLNGQSQQVASLSGNGAVTSSAAGNSAMLTLASTAAGISTYGGTISNGAGTVSLLLSGTPGSGEFLSGVNTFTGSASVAANAGQYSSLILANSGALLGATLVNANGVIFDKSVSPANFTIGGLAGGGTLILVNNGGGSAQAVALSVGANNQNTTFAGTIEDGAVTGGSLIKVGTGTLTLDSFGNYGGVTAINGGELCPFSPVSIPGTITFGGGALQYDSVGNNTTDYSGAIFSSSGAIAIDTNGQQISFGTSLDSSNIGGLTKLGAGTLFLTVSNSYSGTTTLSGGTLNVSDPGAIPAGSSLTFAGGALQYSAPNAVDYSSAPYGIVNSSGAIAVDTNSQNVTYAGVIGSSNSGGLTKIGAGTLLLGGNNSYGGTTAILAGVLQLGAVAGIPANSPLNLSAGTLDVNGFSPSFLETSTFSAGGTVTNSGPLAATVSLLSTSTDMTIDSLLTDGAHSLAFSVSSLGGANGHNFDFTNPNNTFSGGVNISNASGRLIGSSTSSGYAGTGTITISNSGFIMIWANSGSYAGSVTIGNNFVLNTIGGSQISSGGGSSLQNEKTAIFADGDAGGAQRTILSGSIDLASAGGVDAYNGGNPDSLYITGPIYGPGALVKGINGSNGGGLVTLANTANSYSGGTIINTGTLAIMADGSLGNVNGNVTFFGGTLQADNNIVLSANRQILIPGAATLNSQNFTVAVPGNISGTGALTTIGGSTGVVVLSGSNTYSGGTMINGGVLVEANTAALPGYAATLSASSVSVAPGATLAVQAGTLAGEFASSDVDNVRTTANFSAFANLGIRVTAPESFVYNSSITDSTAGALGIVKLGSGLLSLGGSNNYTGGTTISGGTLSLTNAAAIPAASAVAFAGGTLQYTASNTVDYSVGIANSSGPIAIDTNGQNVTFASPIAGSNVGGLTKIGSGALTLTANSLYSGLTKVSGGTLQLGDGVTNNGSVLGNISNNSALVIANPLGQVYAGAISGSGSVTKTGAGTLVLAINQGYTGPTAINAGIVQLGTGTTNRFFNNGALFTVTNNNIVSTPFTGNVLTLTDNGGGEARSAYYNAPLNIATPFTASFVYQASGNLTADGVAFVLQNDSRGLGALGNTGGALGYQDVTPSSGIGLDLFNSVDYGGTNIRGTQYMTGGNVGMNMSTGSVNLASGDPIQVTLGYDGSNLLVETLTDLTNSNTFSTTYAVGSLAATVSGNSAYVGFTGATGGLSSIQTISDFTFTPAGPVNILPAATALSISSGGTLDLYGANQTVASLSGSGTVTNSGTNLSTLTVNGSSATEFDGTINNGSLQVALAVSSGTLVLGGTNSYTGGTMVDGQGVLILNDTGAIPDGSSLLVGDASLFPLFSFGPVVPSPAVSVGAATVESVPEPGTLALLAAAALAAGWKIRRRKCLRANKQVRST
jgi:fibronectin-binding autotransporter adhesin